jgi:hypothetical protein
MVKQRAVRKAGEAHSGLLEPVPSDNVKVRQILGD